MTNQEAIEKLQSWIDTSDEMLQRWNNKTAAEEIRENAEVYKIAIAALKEKVEREESQARDDELFRALYKRDIE